jgi:hypothetical protein
MAAFTGYYDTGGAQHQGSHMVTVGVVATGEEWDAFDLRWLEALRKYEVQSFHMVEIMWWRGDNTHWPLRGGKRDEERLTAFLLELVMVGASFVRQGFVRAVALDDYRAMDTRYPLTETIGGPYTMAQAACLIQSQEWFIQRNKPANQHQWGARVEKGDQGQHEFRKFCEKYLVYMPTFEPKKNKAGEDITPYGLADLIAYEHFVLYKQWIKAQAQIPRQNWTPVLRAIRENIFLDARIVETGFLNKFVTGLKLPLREGVQ